jgi:hypothetical protein
MPYEEFLSAVQAAAAAHRRRDTDKGATAFVFTFVSMCLASDENRHRVSPDSSHESNLDPLQRQSLTEMPQLYAYLTETDQLCKYEGVHVALA